MLTWSLQFAGALLFLTVGLGSIAVCRRARFATAAHAAAWRVNGIVFTVHGLIFTFHNLWGLQAIRAGRESETMRVYLLASPVLNHSRTFLLLAFCLVMLALALRPESVLPRVGLTAGCAFAAGLAAGAVLGLMEGGFIGQVHYAAVAQWDAIELVLLLVMLFVALLADTMDRLNWGVLAVYAFFLALNVVWFAAMTALNQPGVWSPRPQHLHMVRVVLLLVMVGMVAWRYRLARTGTRVSGLTGTAPAPVTSHVGAGWMG